MAGYGKLALKLFELFIQGFYLSLPRSRKERRQFYLENEKIWYEADRKQLFRILKRFRLEGVVKSIKEKDGVERLVLTDKGKAKYLWHQFNNLNLAKEKKWDGVWRIVLFDIPETIKNKRNALRRKLKKLGFIEFQKSVFVYPYPCEDEINFVINFFKIYDYVYYLESSIKPDDEFRASFGIK